MRIRAPPKEERHTMRVICTNLEDAYQQGYADAMESVRKKCRKKQEKKARRQYYIKQKLHGVAMLIFTALVIPLLDGDVTIALLTVPMGLILIFSKEMLIVNKYYWENQRED